MIVTSGRRAGDGRDFFAREGALDGFYGRVVHEFGPRVAAQDTEGKVRCSGREGRRHTRVFVLFDLQRLRPLILNRVAKPVQRTHTGVSAPGEDQLPHAAHADQLIADQIRREANHGQPAPLLPDDFLPSGRRNQVCEAF